MGMLVVNWLGIARTMCSGSGPRAGAGYRGYASGRGAAAVRTFYLFGLVTTGGLVVILPNLKFLYTFTFNQVAPVTLI